jgi:hypothetical protein
VSFRTFSCSAATAAQTRCGSSLLAGALFTLDEDEAKTSGPARALANNRNAANGEERLHARFIASVAVAVKPLVAAKPRAGGTDGDAQHFIKHVGVLIDAHDLFVRSREPASRFGRNQRSARECRT